MRCASDIRKFNVASQHMGQISSGQMSEGEHQHASLFPNIQHSTFHRHSSAPVTADQSTMHTTQGDVNAVQKRTFCRRKRFWTCTTFPTFQHSGFYFPPAASKDRAVNSIEIKDFIILWTYSQWRRDLVFIPPFSPEREMCCILPLIGFRMLILCKREHSISFLQSANIARSLAAGLPSWMWPDQFSYQSYVSAC